jgi:hypothetical protein
MLKRDIIRNLENGLRGLSSVPSSRSSNLRGLEGKDLLMTSGQEFLSHLKLVVNHANRARGHQTTAHF